MLDQNVVKCSPQRDSILARFHKIYPDINEKFIWKDKIISSSTNVNAKSRENQ